MKPCNMLISAGVIFYVPTTFICERDVPYTYISFADASYTMLLIGHDHEEKNGT